MEFILLMAALIALAYIAVFMFVAKLRFVAGTSAQRDANKLMICETYSVSMQRQSALTFSTSSWI